MADKILEIADETSDDTVKDGEATSGPTPNELSARACSRHSQWLLSKTLPKVYSDKLEFHPAALTLERAIGRIIELWIASASCRPIFQSVVRDASVGRRSR